MLDRVFEEEIIIGILNFIIKIEDFFGSFEVFRSKDDEFFVDYLIIMGNCSDVVNILIWEKF